MTHRRTLIALAIAIMVAGLHHRLPGSWPTILPRGRVVELLAGFGVEPGGAGRFGQDGGVQTNLLVSRWAQVVVGEDGGLGAQTAVHGPGSSGHGGRSAWHGSGYGARPCRAAGGGLHGLGHRWALRAGAARVNALVSPAAHG